MIHAQVGFGLGKMVDCVLHRYMFIGLGDERGSLYTRTCTLIRFKLIIIIGDVSRSRLLLLAYVYHR